MQRLVGKADKTPALCERTCECLQSLGLLLEDHSCRGGSCPQLQGCDSHLLAVGAYVTGMSQIDANAAVMAWLHTHIQVLLHSSQSLHCVWHAFLVLHQLPCMCSFIPLYVTSHSLYIGQPQNTRCSTQMICCSHYCRLGLEVCM